MTCQHGLPGRGTGHGPCTVSDSGRRRRHAHADVAHIPAFPGARAQARVGNLLYIWCDGNEDSAELRPVWMLGEGPFLLDAHTGQPGRNG